MARYPIWGFGVYTKKISRTGRS